MNTTDLAYVAGIFDGEGCIGYYSTSKTGTPYYHALVNITMTEDTVVNMLPKLFGFGKISVHKPKDGTRRTAYQWQVGHKKQVREFLMAIRPYLVGKAEQADVVLQLFKAEDTYIQRQGSVTPEVIARRREVELKLKALKREQLVLEGVETR
jgi:hypothetical protein